MSRIPDAMGELAKFSPPEVDFRDGLLSMYRGEAQCGADGVMYQLDETTRISIAEGMTLRALCLEHGVASSLEVGLAYGFSTLFLLAAHAGRGGGSHTAIDPYQTRDWHGIGATHAQTLASRSSPSAPLSFEWIEDSSHRSLVDLERAGRRFGLVFIDGFHRFDDVLVDFYLAAKLCDPGCLVVFHDMWLESVQAVASFIRHNRKDFSELETSCRNLCVFRRVADDRREWSHFIDFPHPNIFALLRGSATNPRSPVSRAMPGSS
jgi:predicted O-methyltransferase YrrM